MNHWLVISLVCATSGTALGQVRLDGYDGNTDNSPPAEREEILFWGDLTPEFGLGCSNASGTWGGPNDIAVRMTATILPPFFIESIYYNIFTSVSPNINQLDFVIWESQVGAGHGRPGAELFRYSLAPHWDEGDHTVAIPPEGQRLCGAQFFVGMSQPQSDVGIRWGVDSSSGSWGTSLIRAPACGAQQFTLLDNLGYPGNFVLAVTVDAAPDGDCGSTPVELRTWGSVKRFYSNRDR